MKKLFKFRQFRYRYVTIYLFQKGRWSFGFTLDVNGTVTSKPDWSTWLFSIDLIYLYIEIHNKNH